MDSSKIKEKIIIVDATEEQTIPAYIGWFATMLVFIIIVIWFVGMYDKTKCEWRHIKMGEEIY